MKKSYDLENLQDTNANQGIGNSHSRDPSPVRIFDTRDLFADDSEIGITHRESFYRLRITRGGKLILNK